MMQTLSCAGKGLYEKINSYSKSHIYATLFGLLGVYSVATKQFIKAYCYWAVTLNFLDKIDSANQTCDSFAYRKLSMALHQVLPSLQSQK